MLFLHNFFMVVTVHTLQKFVCLGHNLFTGILAGDDTSLVVHDLGVVVEGGGGG